MSRKGIGNKDWERNDIVWALRKKGANLCEVSRKSGLHSRTLNNSLYRKWPKGDSIIANAIGVDVSVIWPSRYNKEALCG